MPALPDYKVSPSVQPKPQDYGYDLDKALASVMGLHAIIPGDAFTAETLGTERAGNAVLIRENGVVLTIGYLITEAETVWLHLNDGRVVPGHEIGRASCRERVESVGVAVACKKKSRRSREGVKGARESK